jgi:hypothetical protein
MRDSNAVDRKPSTSLRRKLTQFRDRHRFVSFVIEVQRPPSMRIVTHAAIKGNDGAIRIRSNVSNQGGAIDRFTPELDEIVRWGGRHGVVSAGELSHR